MSNIITRDFIGMDTTFPVRIVELNDQPWFVAKDVCAIFGLANTTLALRPLAQDEKGLNRIKTPGGVQTLNCISESGLYKLVMRSDKPQARLFQDWVTRDVLPAIRKDGAYIMGEEKVASGEMSEDEFVLKAIRRLSSPATTTATSSSSALTATST